jgi:tRNA dimethylallyltransferase
MKITVITGQTATGKTSTAIALAKNRGGELISADSRQAYQHLDIITGKDVGKAKFVLVKKTEDNFNIGYYRVNSINIWLYDILPPNRYFSAFDWQKLACMAVAEITKRKKHPIIVGGSYFYIKSFLYGLSKSIGPDWLFRKKLELLSLSELQKILKRFNHERFNSLNHSDINNKRRLIRWVEKEKAVTNPKTVAEKVMPITDINNVELIGLRYNKASVLREQIEARVEDRLKHGAVEEVQILLDMGYTKTDFGLLTIGYQQVIEYLQNEFNYEEMKTRWIRAEIQYAKRQITLMKKDNNINWQPL